jgi:hypothetical protein
MYKERRPVKGDRFQVKGEGLLPVNVHPSEITEDGKDCVCSDLRWPATGFLRESRWGRQMTRIRFKADNRDGEEESVILKGESTQIQSDLEKMHKMSSRKGELVKVPRLRTSENWKTFLPVHYSKRKATGLVSCR